MTDQQKRIGSIVLAVVTIGTLVVVFWRNYGSEEIPANSRTLMDSETGEFVKVRTEDLKPYPMLNPKTGKNTLFRTEVCLWGDECRKRGGTHVIMNTLMGKPEPTYCPVCKHVVRFHNPVPEDYVPPSTN
jgi:hypothetical protein